MDYKKDKVFISYDDNGKKVEGMFELLLQTDQFIKIKSSEGNILILPYHKVNKIKMKREVNKI